MGLKKLPIGIQTLSEIIDYGYVYVDKTEHIYNMINSGKYYFLSRPRRFGKSLTISTLESIFLGKKELFKDLYISKTNYPWEEHPVIKISFSSMPTNSTLNLVDALKEYLYDYAQEHEIKISSKNSPASILSTLVKKLSAKNKVVVLIDEYDCPIISNITDTQKCIEMREILKSFYIVLKDLDPYLKFVFLTGVSKFSKVSVFSGLNNLNDISMDENFAQICGYTHEELLPNFDGHIKKLATKFGISCQDCAKKLLDWYDGYSFSTDTNLKVFNPFSILMCFAQLQFSNYWFKSATPAFLVKLIQNGDYNVENFNDSSANEAVFDSFEVESIPLKGLLFQTGYLTIKYFDPEKSEYSLGYPNKEVENSLINYLMIYFSKISDSLFYDLIKEIKKTLINNNLPDFVNTFNSILTQIPHELYSSKEQHYQTIFYLICQAAGFYTQVEVSTSLGSIDATIEINNIRYIFEFKVRDNAQSALEQIKRKQYYKKFMAKKDPSKKLILVGIFFDTKQRQLTECVAEEVK